MRRSLLVALSRAALLVLLVGALGTAAALAHHHDGGSAPSGACGLCVHAASVATAPSHAVYVAPQARSGSVAPAAMPQTHDGRHSRPRGRGPPPAASRL